MVDFPMPTTVVPTLPRFQIFPAIGIARVGDSHAYTYIASETPQIDHVPEGGYRGPGEMLTPPSVAVPPNLSPPRRIKRMGCRFRIYEFSETGDGGYTPTGEITLDDAEIEWTVELVNRKAGAAADWGMGIAAPGPLNGTHDPFDGPIPAQYIIASGPVTITGRGQGPLLMAGGIMTGLPNTQTVKLGDLTTDAEGRLVIYGGHGVAASWRDPAPEPDQIRNPGWFDDTSDGIVRATVRINGETHEALAARIVVGPPDYAHPCIAPVSLFDLAFMRSGGTEPETSFTDHIHPILHRSAFLEWTLFKISGGDWGRTPKHGHGYTANHDMHPEAAFFDPRIFSKLHDINSTRGQALRNMFLVHLKDPSGNTEPLGQGENYNMPAIEGLTFTQVQYEHFYRFSADLFTPDWDESRDPCVLHPPQGLIPTGDMPKQLNRAAMDFAVGGPFFPGVEVGAIVDDPASYKKVGNEDDAIDFRVRDSVPAGALTASLAVPWQVGFNQHNYQSADGERADNLSPSARPVVVAAKQSGTSDDMTWTRPFTNRRGDIFERQKMRTNRHMIDHWSQLGFIAPAKFYIETDRTLPEDPDYPI